MVINALGLREHFKESSARMQHSVPLFEHSVQVIESLARDLLE